MKSCKVCPSVAEFFVGSSYLCSKHLKLADPGCVLVKVMQDENQWKTHNVRAKGLKRLKKLESLSRSIHLKTAEILVKVNQLHSEAILKVNQERIRVLEMINSPDVDEVYLKLNKKYFCGLMKQQVELNELETFYSQEMFCEVENQRLQFSSLACKMKALETRFSLIVEDFEPPASLLALSNNGDFLALVDGKLFVQVFSLPDKEHVAKLQSPASLTFLAFSSDDQVIRGLTKQGLMLTWDLSSGSLLSKLQISEAEVKTCRSFRENLFFSTIDLKVYRMSLENFEVEFLFDYKAEINSLTIFVEPAKLVGSSGGDVFIFDLQTKEISVLITGNSPVTALDCGKNSDLVAVALTNKNVLIWSVGQGKCLAKLTGHFDLITYLMITADDSQLLTYCLDKKLRVYNISNKKLEHCFNPLTQQVTSIISSADQKNLFISSGELKKLSCLEKKLIDLQLTRGHSSAVNCLVLTKSKAFTGSKDKTIKIWKLGKKKLVSTLTGHNDEVTDLVLSSSKKLLISASNDKTIRSWDLRDNKMLVFSPPGAKSVKLWLDPKAETLVSLTSDRNIRVFSVMTGKMIHMFQSHSVLNCGFFVFEDLIVSASEDKNLKILNIPEKKVEKTFAQHQTSIVCIDANRNTVVSVSADGLANVCNSEGFSLVSSFAVGPAVQVVLSDDSKYLACKYSTAVKFWNLKTLTEADCLKSILESDWVKRYQEFTILDASN